MDCLSVISETVFCICLEGTFSTRISDSFMHWLYMCLNISPSGCLKGALITKKPDPFVFGFEMLHKMVTLSRFIIAFLARNSHLFMYSIDVFIQARFAFTRVSAISACLTFDSIFICSHFNLDEGKFSCEDCKNICVQTTSLVQTKLKNPHAVCLQCATQRKLKQFYCP